MNRGAIPKLTTDEGPRVLDTEVAVVAINPGGTVKLIEYDPASRFTKR